MKQLNLQALKSFHEIVRTGTGVAAARRLGLSQSGVSRLISQLEAAVGFELFYRGKGLVPTPEGRLVFEEVSLAFLNIDRINALINDIRTHNTGELKIVASPAFSEAVLPALVTLFLQSYPNVRLHLDSPPGATARFQVVTRAADCGFSLMPLEQTDIRAEKIMGGETSCILSRKHPLAKEPHLTPRLLKSQPLIQLGAGSYQRMVIDAEFKKAQVHPDVKIETHTVGAACALAASGLGIAIANGRFAKSYLKNGLVMRPFRPRIMQDYAFITSALLPMSRLAQAFLDIARKHFREQPAPNNR
jgi:DNA-binding transcriptional LysR family regulator